VVFAVVLLGGLLITKSWPDEFQPQKLLRKRAG